MPVRRLRLPIRLLLRRPLRRLLQIAIRPSPSERPSTAAPPIPLSALRCPMRQRLTRRLRRWQRSPDRRPLRPSPCPPCSAEVFLVPPEANRGPLPVRTPLNRLRLMPTLRGSWPNLARSCLPRDPPFRRAPLRRTPALPRAPPLPRTPALSRVSQRRRPQRRLPPRPSRPRLLGAKDRAKLRVSAGAFRASSGESRGPQPVPFLQQQHHPPQLQLQQQRPRRRPLPTRGPPPLLPRAHSLPLRRVRRPHSVIPRSRFRHHARSGTAARPGTSRRPLRHPVVPVCRGRRR